MLLVVGLIVRAALTPNSAPSASDADSRAVVQKATTVPASVYDQVGTGGLKNPLRATGGSAVIRDSSGKLVVFYLGGEFCPYCAAERWSLVAALSRFGTFTGLGLTTSSSTDAYPNTPTLTFHGSTFSGDLIDVQTVESSDRNGNPLDPLNPTQQGWVKTYNPQGGIPFVLIGGRYTASGAGFQPDLLQGHSWTQIADSMRDPSSPIARAVIGNANFLTAAICRSLDSQPPVCATPGVTQAAAQIG